MLEVKKINTYYDDFKVLHDISLKVKKGHFVSIIGPNGHGKSTLLKTICGLIRPSSGHIIFNNKIVNGLPPNALVHKGITYVAEKRNLFSEMTVFENLKLGAYSVRSRKKEKENLEYVFELFPKLKTRKNQLASTLSGGEARMLAIGRGLMSSAKLLAIDEPSLGLAPNLRVEVFNKIGEINKMGITILLVEQTITEAAEYINKVYLLEDGRIMFEGKPKEALSNKHIKKAFLGL